jgi:enoyl-CoA hydratase/carnithine racemase
MRLIDRWLTDDKARVVIITGNRRRMFAKKQMNQMRGLQTQ